MKSEVKLEIYWKVQGHVFINGKFSHSVKIELGNQCSGSTWQGEECDDLMLGVLNGKTVEALVNETNLEAQKIIDNACANLTELRQKKNEYPFKRSGRR